MGRAAEFFTPILQAHCRVVGVVCLSADRAGKDFDARWSAKFRATTGAVWRCAVRLLTASPDALYLPVSQGGLPLCRDLLIVTLARMFGCAAVVHLHGSQLPARLASSRVLRALLTGAHWIVLSEAVAAELRASGCRAQSVAVVRNPAPPMSAPPEASAPGDALCVGWLGTMCRAKGFDIVCRSVRRLKDRGLPLTFTVAGLRLDGSAADMACVDEDLGVLGPGQVVAFWRSADVFVLPARWAEGLPFVLLEGLQAGCVVAATRSAGAAELFGQGCVESVDSTVDSVTGFLQACTADLEAMRRRQRKAWLDLAPLYEPTCVEESFVRFWQDNVRQKRERSR
ncbi:glycosyltransferase family 4 protein [Streptomyces actuosus]|uniref:D-inositol 3-phosphate glycosyltransferase n=1 Tax=Streptomyces actuosus TaxID=1885 RepID=A0ABS2W092_STRAS|nr:glycosyltransferase family 4 protein [Streptomyces actuosus]MBN0048820.1 glycosyltransferase family 4 protein [Streptomyces actuosus]